MPQLDIQPIEDKSAPVKLDIQPLDIQPIEQPPEQPGMMSRIWHGLSDPLTDAPSRFAKSIGDYIDQPVNRDDTYLSGVMARAKGFGAGALQGIGDLVSGLSSPINLGTALLTGGESVAAKAGLPNIARAASLGSKALSAPVVLHGASNVLSPDSTLSQRAQGLAEMAGGGAAMFHTPSESKISGAVGEASEKAGPEVKPPVSTAPEASKGSETPVSGADIVDKYKAYREAPVGTKYTIKPETFNRKKLTDAVKLGFDVSLQDDGRLAVTKVRESPKLQEPETPEFQKDTLAQVANLPRTLMASMDLSAPLRQGLGLVHRKEFWKALPDMVKAFGSEDFYNAAQKSITDDPIFQRSYNAQGQIVPSFAERAGLKLTDLNGGMANREENIMSNLADKVPLVRPSERAYTLFLNKLRADTFKQMATDYKAFSGLDMRNNLGLAKDLATVVNTSTGRGSLGALEPSAKALASVFFSPRLMASRLQMMNPQYYMTLSPVARREALKSLFAVAGAAGTFATLGKMSGAEVESDPASSDFGKVKFGNTRLDPYGGFQQYVVAAQRLMPNLDLSSMGMGDIGGKMKSTTTGKEYNLGDPAFGRSTRSDVLLRFLRSKTNPIINFGWGLLAGQKELSGKPMNFGAVNPLGQKGENLFDNSIAQRFLPMLSQDIYDLVTDETTSPQEKALAAFLASTGMGSQTYGNER